MTDYTELVKALRCCATMTCKGDDCRYMILGCHDCFSKLHDEMPTASPWHRVEEPPKEEGKYLVCDGRGNYYVAWWGPRLGWCYDPKFFCYWMPIEPPKEEEE